MSAFLAPETVEDPKNQTVVAGFNVTLNCTAKGSPMPSITWIKNNDPLAIQSNPRIKYIKNALDDKQIHSQLVIEDAKKKDEGKYHCVANNTVGEKASNPAFLSIEDLGETYAVYYFLTWHQVLSWNDHFFLWKGMKETLKKLWQKGKCFRFSLNLGNF